MHIVVFGLTISSSWGNGHATPWRGLCRALAALGHRVTFFEKDVPYYAAPRDAPRPNGCDLRLYRSWHDIAEAAQRLLDTADVGMVTSYCPDAHVATALVLDSPAETKIFYDLDAPVTLARLRRGDAVDYVPPQGYAGFDLVLSFTGGDTLAALATELGATAVAPLYGSVDPDAHRPVRVRRSARFDLTYLGTYSPDRQAALETFLIEPARRHPTKRFAIAGSMYPATGFPWEPNIYYLTHMPPPDHPAFYCASDFTLNITRGPMAAAGFCPSGRLFEAAACGTPIVSDAWPGLERFFEPGSEIVVAASADDVLAALDMDRRERSAMARRARERVLAFHTADRRARELEGIIEHVGHHSRGGAGQSHAAARVLQGAAAGRQPA
jgi:spore maturation protein CgeB